MKVTIVVTFFVVGFTGFVSAKDYYFANPKESSGQLILSPNKTTRSLFPVTLLSINGKEVARRNNSVWLKPGSYRLSFSAIVNHNYAGGNGLNIKRNNNRTGQLKNDLDIIVEDNKTYYIAFNASDDRQENWRPVIWKQRSR